MPDEEKDLCRQIDVTIKYAADFYNSWKSLRDKETFPECVIATGALSMTEDLARQLAVIAAQLQELQKIRRS